MASYETNATAATSPVRVAFCITELEPGGAERCLVELATRLDRRRFEPVVYCLGPRPAGNPISLVERLEAAGVAVHCFGARRPLALPGLLRRLRRQMQLDRPRLVQTFLFHANVLGAWAARGAGVPHVVSGIRVAERHSAWHLLVAQCADRWVDRHVCVSRSVRDFSVTQGRLRFDKLVVIPNAVDVERFAGAPAVSRSELGVDGRARLIAYVGRLDRQKGVRWLVEAIQGVLNEHADVELVMVGDGPERMALERFCAARTPGRVHFLGTRADVPEILAAADLLVLPSRWEGMPNVVLEAMAAGLPVVATDVEGVREALGWAPTHSSPGRTIRGDLPSESRPCWTIRPSLHGSDSKTAGERPTRSCSPPWWRPTSGCMGRY